MPMIIDTTTVPKFKFHMIFFFTNMLNSLIATTVLQPKLNYFNSQMHVFLKVPYFYLTGKRDHVDVIV